MSPIFFAQGAPDAGPTLIWRFDDSATIEWLIILGAIGLVTLLALVWAAFFRKRNRRAHSRHHHHHPRHSSESSEAPGASTEADDAVPREKRRHRRRSHHRPRPLNPTLAETGGLPPIRPEEPPETKP